MGNAFEDSFINGLDQSRSRRNVEYNSEAIPAAAHEKANALIRKREIKLAQFADLYDKRKINEDLAYVRDTLAAIAEQNSVLEKETGKKTFEILKAASVFEALALEGIDHGWLGRDARAIKTSRFDDLANKIDVVAEYQKDGERASHLGLGLDVTFSERGSEDKITQILQEIESGNLGKVRYFISERTHIRGELSGIPRVIVGAELSKVVNASRLWAGNSGSIAESPIQYLVAPEILMQLEAFREHARRHSQPQLAEIFDFSYQLVKQNRPDRGIAPAGLLGDRVYQRIKKFTQALN